MAEDIIRKTGVTEAAALAAAVKEYVVKNNPCSVSEAEGAWVAPAEIVCNEMMADVKTRKPATELLSNEVFAGIETGVPNKPALPVKEKKAALSITQDNYMDILKQLEGGVGSTFSVEDKPKKKTKRKGVNK